MDWWSIGDMERSIMSTQLQETGMVDIHGNTPLLAILSMVDDLGIDHKEVSIANGFEGIVVTVHRVRD